MEFKYLVVYIDSTYLCANSIELDKQVQWLLSRGVDPTNIGIEVVPIT